MARTPRGSTLAPSSPAALIAAGALLVALTVMALAGCDSPALSAKDPLAGYWIGGGATGMKLVHVVKDGDTYAIYANPDYPAPSPTMKGDSLVIDAHAVKMTLTPAGTDKLTHELSGSALEKPQTTTLGRVSETQYAEAATSFGLDAIRRGLKMWMAGGAKKYPPPSEVTATGMLGQMMAWPNNLFTGQPMQPGKNPGDYVYKSLDAGKKYSLIGYLSDGSTIGE